MRKCLAVIHAIIRDILEKYQFLHEKALHTAHKNGSSHRVKLSITLLSVTLYKEVLEVTELYNQH